jgi:GT2 family glycosyltransferase
MRPGLTIGVPSFQRHDQLRALLDSVERAVAEPLVAGRDLEIVVVLDGSTDGSAEMLAEWSQRSALPVRYHWQPNAGLAAARNALVRAACHELIWLLDDDMVVTATALDRHIHHDRQLAPILMGPCEVVGDAAVLARLGPYYAERHGRLAAAGVVTCPKDCSFANTSAPTRLLLEYPFDERFRGYGLEDTELAWRLLRSGVAVAFDSLAGVEHHCRPSLADRLRTMREAGRSMVRLAQIHPVAAPIAFEEDVSSFERLLRRAARPVLARLLFGAAGVVQRVGATWGPQRRGGWRINALAEQLAVYAGVADAGGVPADKAAAAANVRAR